MPKLPLVPLVGESLSSSFLPPFSLFASTSKQLEEDAVGGRASAGGGGGSAWDGSGACSSDVVMPDGGADDAWKVGPKARLTREVEGGTGGEADGGGAICRSPPRTAPLPRQW